MTKAEALEASIKHWEELSRRRVAWTVEIGPKYCALCELFRDYDLVQVDDPARCNGCPVQEKTGKPDCNSTPYDRAARHLSDDFGDEVRMMKHFRDAARDEIRFLKSLRTVQ